MINGFIQPVTKHVIAESTNIQATYWADHIYNVVASADIDNGKLVNLTDMAYYKNATGNGLIVGANRNGAILGNDKFSNGECFTMVEPTATCKVGLILSVPVGYEESPWQAKLDSNFYNGKGEVMRVYELNEGDRFTVSIEGITALASGANAKPVVGNYVVADGYDLKESASKGTGSFVGEIIEEITRTNGKFYKIYVRKNG